MKRKLLSAITLIAVLLAILSACSGVSGKNAAIDDFSARVASIAKENSELAGYSMSGLTEEGNGTYAASAVIDGETIGAISIVVADKQVTELSFSFSGAVAIDKCMLAATASAMAVDSALDYSEAYEMMARIIIRSFVISESRENNGYSYTAWYENELLFVKMSKI